MDTAEIQEKLWQSATRERLNTTSAWLNELAAWVGMMGHIAKRWREYERTTAADWTAHAEGVLELSEVVAAFAAGHDDALRERIDQQLGLVIQRATPLARQEVGGTFEAFGYDPVPHLLRAARNVGRLEQPLRDLAGVVAVHEARHGSPPPPPGLDGAVGASTPADLAAIVRRGHAPRPRRELTDVQLDARVAYLLGHNGTLAERKIAEAIGVSRHRVRKSLARLGRRRGAATGGRPRRDGLGSLKLDAGELEQLREMDPADRVALDDLIAESHADQRRESRCVA